MKKLVVRIVLWYQKYLSPDQGIISYFVSSPTCGFHPTCSEYCIEAVLKYGVLKGFLLFLRRMARCHPGAEPKVDLVP